MATVGNEARLRQADPTLPARERLIVALDFNNRDDALGLVDKLQGEVETYKVGYELFISEGPQIIVSLVQHQKKVFLDLKMDDIGVTMSRAVTAIKTLGVSFLTLKGNGATARAAREGRGAGPPPLFLQVTYLSSQDEADLHDEYGANIPLQQFIRIRAEKILEAGCDGVIASGASVGDLRGYLDGRVARVKTPTIVVPGIRPEWAEPDDHKRFLTPTDAIHTGADYLVVGRPIRHASDPADAAHRIIDEIHSASNV